MLVEALVDLDSLLYQAALQGEHTEYVACIDGKLVQFTTRDALLDATYETPASAIYSCTVPGDFDACTKALQGKIADIQIDLNDFAKEHGASGYLMRYYMGGSGNFRERIKARVPYKHNRYGKPKPHYLGKLMQFAEETLGAERVHFWEADDQVAMEHTMLLKRTDRMPVCVSIDKDLRQLAGTHYIPGKGFLTLTSRSAWLNFYAQCISGDTADGVPGCYKAGAATAEKALAPARECMPAEFHRIAWQCVLTAYRQQMQRFGEAKCGYANADAAALETARFVYLLRRRPSDPAAITLWEPML